MAKIPFDGSCEAEYADGYIHSETELGDISPYGPKNIFDDILHKRPESEHGSLVRFSVFYQNNRYDVSWLILPESARPVRFKNFERESRGGLWVGDPMLATVDFGYQYTDEDGKNVQEIIRL